MKKLALALILLLCCSALTLAKETASVIKVNGKYAIINKGINQGINNRQLFTVQRSLNGTIQNIGDVRVIRTTPNRAAVELLSQGKGQKLSIGDILYFKRNDKPRKQVAQSVPLNTVKKSEQKYRNYQNTQKGSSIKPIKEPNRIPETKEAHPTEVIYSNSVAKIKKPWIEFNTGFIFPNGALATSYLPKLKMGGSYMVAAGKNTNVGIELNNTFVNGTSSGNFDASELSTESASLFEAFVVMQRFFGRYFFIETGGGIYRPKIQTVNMDGVRASFSSTHFGLFGGTGVFIPTSPYAGLSLKTRFNNYFDRTSKSYFGFTGGFRFKIK